MILSGGDADGMAFPIWTDSRIAISLSTRSLLSQTEYTYEPIEFTQK